MRVQKSSSNVAVVFVMSVLVALAGLVGYQVREHQAFCSAASEDSVISGCDYHDGHWYGK